VDQGSGDDGVMDKNLKVFASRFWGFSPDTHPAVTFGNDGHRDRLLRLSGPDDLVLFVGTQDYPTEPSEQGRLLGLAQFGRVPVDALEILNRDELPDHSFKNGRYKWPKALAMTKAWRFNEPRPFLIDVLQDQLPMYATVGVVELDITDREAVLALPMTEIPVKASEASASLSELQSALSQNRKTRGPSAVSWSGEITRDVSGAAQTYALQFAKSNVWKIGWAKDAKARCCEINTHIPHEYLNEKWELRYVQNWPTGEDAFRMEQRLLNGLDHLRTVGERLKCDPQQLLAAWIKSIKAL
jgi:hypothetical protein